LRHTSTNDKAREFDKAVKFGTEEHVSFKEEQVAGHDYKKSPLKEKAIEFDKHPKSKIK
jgi:hypothetical protein